MNIKDLEKNWNVFGAANPMWAVLTSTMEWDNDQFFATGRREIGELLKETARLNINFEKGKALDFGCGVGRLSQALADYFAEVNGVDIASSMVETASKLNRFGSKVQYFLNTANDLSLFGDNSFDFIYSNITLQHMEPSYAKNYIAEFIRVLKPGGLLVFQIPDELKGQTKWKRFIKSYTPIAAIKLFRRWRGAVVKLGARSQKQPYAATMEMYGMQLQNVVKLVKAKNGKVLNISLDRRETAHEQWVCYQYFVTK